MKRKLTLPILAATAGAAILTVSAAVYLCATSKHFLVCDGYYGRRAGSLTLWRTRSCMGFPYNPKDPYYPFFESPQGCDTSGHFSRSCIGVPVGAWECRAADEDGPSWKVPCE